jgi:hypothetical protein
VHHERTLTDIQAQRVGRVHGRAAARQQDKGDAKDMANRCTSNPR